jgi:tetratricopeptide (TPR) repeat protein
MVNFEEAWEILGEILGELDIDKNNLLLIDISYLKGKYYEGLGKWNESIEHYQKTIKLVDCHPEKNCTNLKAASFNGLGRIHHRLNNLDQALFFVEEGLKYFVHDGNRSYIEHNLYINKVIYLEKLNRDDEALALIEKIWSKILHIVSSETVLNLYQMRAHLCNKLELFEQAICYAFEGIEMARINRMYDRSFELWATLADIYSKKGYFRNAEICFKSSLGLKHKIRNKYLLAPIYTSLGLLYLETEKVELSQSAIEEAISLSIQSKNDFYILDSKVAMGDLLVKKKSNLKANKFYTEALKIAEKYNLLEQQSKILMKMAKSYEDLNVDKYKKCVDQYFQVAIQLEVKQNIKRKQTTFPPRD